MAARKAHEAERDAIFGSWCTGCPAALDAADLRAALVVPLGRLWVRPGPAHLDSGFVTPVNHLGRTELAARSTLDD